MNEFIAYPDLLPRGMVASLPLLPAADMPLMLFTRHSIREQTNGEGFASYALPLTNLGRGLATQWGRLLPEICDRRWSRAISSPIGRCTETAALMLGLPHADHLQTHHLLVEPGSLVLDIAKVGQWFREHGPLHFINAFLQERLPGMKAAEQGVEDILYLLFGEWMQMGSGEMGVAVSHDTLLAAVLGLLMGLKELSWAQWPEMMEGLFVWFEPLPYDERPEFAGATLHWVWRGQHGQYRIREQADPHIR